MISSSTVFFFDQDSWEIVLKNLLLVMMLVSFSLSVHAGEGKYEWLILMKGGEAVQNVALNSLKNDTLYFSIARNFSDYVSLDSIVHISRKKGDAALPGLLIGGVAGGVAGYAVKPETRNESETRIYSTLFGLLVGGGVGFLAGSQFESTEYYDLSVSDVPTKRMIIERLLE